MFSSCKCLEKPFDQGQILFDESVLFADDRELFVC